MLFQLCLVWAFIQGGTDKGYVCFQLILQLKNESNKFKNIVMQISLTNVFFQSYLKTKYLRVILPSLQIIFLKQFF